jgi:hypothetical protein
VSDEVIRRGAMMYVSAVKSGLPLHVSQEREEGIEGYDELSQSLMETGRWLSTHKAVTRNDDGKWTVNDAAINALSGNSRDYEKLHNRMLHDHDRVAPNMRTSGLGGYLDEFTEARVGPLSDEAKETSPKSSKLDFFAHLDASEASKDNGAIDDAAVDAFISKKPEKPTAAMTDMGFTKSDQVGCYLLEAVQRGDSEGILAAQATGVDLSTKMSPAAKHAHFGDELGSGEMSFIHVAAMSDEDAIPAKHLADPAISIRDVNIKDSNGDTALHLAAAHSSSAHVEAWLSMGADPKARNKEGMTPSMEAGLNNRNENTAVLESASARSREVRCSEVAAKLHANRSNANTRASKDRGIDLGG